MHLLAPGHRVNLDRVSSDKVVTAWQPRGEEVVFHPTQAFHGLLTTIQRPWTEQCAQINDLTLIWELSLLIGVDKQLPCMTSNLTIALSVFIV